MDKSLITSAIILCMATTVLAAPTGNVTRGTQIFTQNCQGCHGTKAAGGVGPALAGSKSDVPKWSFQMLNRALMQGLDDVGKPLKAPMPLWSKTKLRASGKPPTDQDVADILAYLKSIR